MKKVLTLILSSLFLVACGGDDNKENSIDEPSLSQISGVWDMTETYNGEEDKYYVVIKDYGEMISYDYDGDSYDKGEDCYWKFTDSITDLGSGFFEVIDESNYVYTLNASISKNKLTFAYGGEVQSYPKSSLQESEFVPLCDEVILRSSTAKEQPKLFYRRQ